MSRRITITLSVLMVFALMTTILSFGRLTNAEEEYTTDTEESVETDVPDESDEISEPEETEAPEVTESSETEPAVPSETAVTGEPESVDSDEVPAYNAPAPDPNGIIFSIEYYKTNGSKWSINDGLGRYDYVILYPADGNAEYHIKAVFSDGTVEEVDHKGSQEELSRLFTASNYDGISGVDYYVTGFTGKYAIRKAESCYFSMVNVDGTNHDPFDFGKHGPDTIVGETAVTDGTVVEIQYYSPATIDGTISFEPYDDSISGDYAYEFYLRFSRYTNNYDLNDTYWTLDSDPSTKHKFDPTDTHYYTFLVTVPLGHTVTLHNLPLDVTVLGGFMPPYQYNAGPSYVTLGGNQITAQEMVDNGLAQNLIYTVDVGDVPDPTVKPKIISSGSIYSWLIGNNFSINTYIMRRQVQFLFTKQYDPTDTYCDANDTHTFKITLKDGGKAYAGKKVAYNIYDSISDTFGTDYQLATTDSKGQFTVDVKAGQYVQVGRTPPSDYPSTRDVQFYSGETTSSMYLSKFEYNCFDEIGMLPSGINYTIEEVSDKYEASTTGDYEDVDLVSGSLSDYWSYYNSQIYYLRNKMYDNAGVESPVFTNSRATGSLSVKKIVKGTDSDDDFTVNVIFTSVDNQFPAQLPCVNPDGTAGTLDVTAGNNAGEYKVTFDLKDGETMQIDGIPTLTLYVVEEDDGSVGDFDVSYKNDSGEITKDGVSAQIINKYSEEEEDDDDDTDDDKPKYVPATGEGTSVYQIVAVVFILAGIAVSTVAYKRTRRSENR